MIRVLFADDHEMVRKALRRILSADGDCIVCGEAADGEEALALCERQVPDVVILDVRMPRLGGIEAARRIGALLPQAAILIVTMHDSTEIRTQALAAGALAFLCKGDIDAHLLPAVRALAGRRPYVPAALKARSGGSAPHSEPARRST